MDMAGSPAPPLAPGTIRHPTHGAFKGHLLPGCFFLIWGTYWLLSVFRLHFKSSEKKPFKSRAWYPFLWPKSVPLEPLLKVVFPFIGINGELWAGHDHYRYALPYQCTVPTCIRQSKAMMTMRVCIGICMSQMAISPNITYKTGSTLPCTWPSCWQEL